MQHLTDRRYRVLSLVTFCLAVTALAQTPKKFPYKEADMRFNAPPVERPIDRDCGAEGTGKGDYQQAQNRAKNNFGAQGTPVPVLITDFDRLEKATLRARNCWAKKQTNCRKLEMDSSGLPVDREELKDIAKSAAGDSVGEGTLVVLEAKVLDSHYSNTKYNFYGFDKTTKKPQFGGGESVNCKGVPSNTESASIARNDIHIVLTAPGITDDCLSVTAEISPHFRPTLWNRFHGMGPTPNSGGKDVNKEAKGVNFKNFQMVRITGPLFYDASHEPCSPGKHASPARRSLWEIHPAYKLEVKVNGQWVDFDDWAETH
jgi:hypothetical protein